MSIPPPPTQLKIFESEPPPTQATFNSGVRATATQEEALSIIMYSPNLQLVGALDNTNSKASSDYGVSVSRGFTFSMSQELTISASAGFNFLLVAAEISVTFALSFTQEWTKTEERSINISCPPGEKAFIYQGTLMSRILALNSQSGQFSWKTPRGKTLTEVVVTRSAQLPPMPSDSFRIQTIP